LRLEAIYKIGVAVLQFVGFIKGYELQVTGCRLIAYDLLVTNYKRNGGWRMRGRVGVVNYSIPRV
jgi:hypothetical protein